jgi:hypothetical protein
MMPIVLAALAALAALARALRPQRLFSSLGCIDTSLFSMKSARSSGPYLSFALPVALTHRAVRLGDRVEDCMSPQL